MEFQDYYMTLGIERSATADDIKKAFRRLALECHPDKAPAEQRDEAEIRFKRANEAYEVLSDPEKRERYDRFGENWEQGETVDPRSSEQWSHMKPEDFEARFGTSGFSDFFESAFGDQYARGFRDTGQPHRRYRVRGADLRAELALPIGEALAGGKRRFDLPAVRACERCGGLGVIETHVCPTCVGMGTVRTHKAIDLGIPKDARDGLTMRLSGLGEPGSEGAPSGDLFITLRLIADDIYSLEGDRLIAELPLAPWEIVHGTKVQLDTPDGPVTMDVAGSTEPGKRLRLRGKGLARADGSRGDFYVVVRMALPTQLTTRQQELLAEIESAGADTVKGGVRRDMPPATREKEAS